MEPLENASKTCLASKHAQRVISLDFYTRWSSISEAIDLGAEDKGFEIFVGSPIRAESSLDLELEAESARGVLARQRPISVAGANCILLSMFRDLRGERGSTHRFCQSAEGLSASVSTWSTDRGSAASAQLNELAIWLANRLLNDAAVPETGQSQDHLQATVSSLTAAPQSADFNPVTGFKLLDAAFGLGATFLLSRHSAIAGKGLDQPDFHASPDDPNRPFGRMRRA